MDFLNLVQTVRYACASLRFSSANKENIFYLDLNVHFSVSEFENILLTAFALCAGVCHQKGLVLYIGREVPLLLRVVGRGARAD